MIVPSVKEKNEEISKIQQYLEEKKKNLNQKVARDSLAKTGMYTKNGNLKPEFK
jgi:hypothetical protein